MKKSTEYRVKHYWLKTMAFFTNGLSYVAHVFAVGVSFMFAFEFFGFVDHNESFTPDLKMAAVLLTLAAVSHFYEKIGEILSNQSEYVHYEMENEKRKEKFRERTGKENEFEEIEF